VVLNTFVTADQSVFPWEELTNHMPRKRVVSPPVYILYFRGPVPVLGLGLQPRGDIRGQCPPNDSTSKNY